MNFLASPLSQFAQNLVHVGIRLATTVNDLLNNLVTLSFGFQDLASICIGLGLELIGGHLIVTSCQGLRLLSLVEHLCLVEPLVEHLNLALAQILLELFILVFLIVDIVAHVVDFSLSLLNCCVELHGVLCGVPQCLF